MSLGSGTSVGINYLGDNFDLTDIFNNKRTPDEILKGVRGGEVHKRLESSFPKDTSKYKMPDGKTIYYVRTTGIGVGLEDSVHVTQLNLIDKTKD